MPNFEFSQIIVEAAPLSIILVASDGRIRFANAKTEQLFGYRREELIGESIEILMPQRHRMCHADQCTAFFKKPSARPMGAGRDLTGKCKDGTEVPLEISLTPVKIESEELALAFMTDISVRKRMTETLREMLEEKETMLREIHHRVKNNLQIISSLLRMQSAHLTDHAAASALNVSRQRVQSMAMIHERLYGDKQIKTLDFAEFTQAFVQELVSAYEQPDARISIVVNTSPVRLNIDDAVPCGLVLNELLTNALKYAFPDNRSGQVTVTLGENCSGLVNLTVSDNGVRIAFVAECERLRNAGPINRGDSCRSD